MFSRTKIVATVGPASRSPEVMGKMIESGLDVARLNFSHGLPEEHRAAVETIRTLAAQQGRPVAILQDLQGPKIRVGRFPGGKVTLVPGQRFVLHTREGLGDQDQVSISYAGLPNDVVPGQTLLLDDGNLRLRVLQVFPTEIITEVEIGGDLKDHKGINVPGGDLAVSALSEKDIEDLIFGVELGVDWVALSFVGNREDLQLARHYLNRHGSEAKLVAKIERPGAVARFDEILTEADGIMVARGDLGVEMNPEEVPVVQKRLIAKTRAAGKPVITATQMLESMITNPRPTRAEASDVANAIFDGTDAVMLSAETAAGKYPVEAVSMMSKVAQAVESSPEYFTWLHARPVELRPTTQDAIALAACQVAESLSAKAIVIFTTSGSSVWRVARHRPQVPILALTPYPKVQAQLNLAAGVWPVLAADPKDTDDMVRLALAKVRETGLAAATERVVIAAGVPFAIRGTTNMIRVEQVL